MKPNLVYLAICSLVVAAIVHIAIVLLVPNFGQKDAARAIMERSTTNKFRTVDNNGKPMLPNADPFFDVASCRFDLVNAGVVASGGETDLFWSAAVFNQRGRVIYSLSKRSTIGNRLRMIVVNPVQMARMRQFQPEDLETSIIVETTESTGFIMIRALHRDASMIDRIDKFMSGLTCTNYLQES